MDSFNYQEGITDKFLYEKEYNRRLKDKLIVDKAHAKDVKNIKNFKLVEDAKEWDFTTNGWVFRITVRDYGVNVAMIVFWWWWIRF